MEFSTRSRMISDSGGVCDSVESTSIKNNSEKNSKSRNRISRFSKNAAIILLLTIGFSTAFSSKGEWAHNILFLHINFFCYT